MLTFIITLILSIGAVFITFGKKVVGDKKFSSLVIIFCMLVLSSVLAGVIGASSLETQTVKYNIRKLEQHSVSSETTYYKTDTIGEEVDSTGAYIYTTKRVYFNESEKLKYDNYDSIVRDIKGIYIESSRYLWVCIDEDSERLDKDDVKIVWVEPDDDRINMVISYKDVYLSSLWVESMSLPSINKKTIVYLEKES